MTENSEQPKTPMQGGPKKGVSIQIMFPCESDNEALAIKKRIDDVVKDVTEKRYTFSISEV